MASNSETGHAKNIANLKTFNTTARGLGLIYNPSNDQIELTKLELIYDSGFNDQNKVNTSEAPYSTAVGEREGLFDNFKKELAKIHRIYKSTKEVTPKQVEDLLTIIRKYRGVRKIPKSKSQDPEEQAKYHSVSQTSYDVRTNTMDTLIAFLKNTPNYEPNEVEFQVATLRNKMQQMLNATDLVSQTFTALNTARSNRNNSLYFNNNNLVDTANTARNYTLGILNKNQPEYKVINKLIFKKIIS